MFPSRFEGNPLFTAGQPDRRQGLERLAEDGNAASSPTTSRCARSVRVSVKPSMATATPGNDTLYSTGAGDRRFRSARLTGKDHGSFSRARIRTKRPLARDRG